MKDFFLLLIVLAIFWAIFSSKGVSPVTGLMNTIQRVGAVVVSAGSGGGTVIPVGGVTEMQIPAGIVNEVQGQVKTLDAVIPAEQSTPSAPPANIKVPSYEKIQAEITPIAHGGLTAAHSLTDPQGQKAQQVMMNLQMGNKNFWTVGTIEGYGDDVKVFTPAGWLSCASIKNLNQFDGDQDLQEWYFSIPPGDRIHAVEACRGAGR